MDVELLIYIILGVVYFLSRMLKKPEQAPNEAPPQQRPERRVVTRTSVDRPVDKPRPMTFEELLREITEAKQPRRPEPESEPEPEPAYEVYEQIPAEESRSLETVEEEESRMAPAWRAYEQIPATERRSLEETMSLADTDVSFERFAQFERKEQKSRAEEYRKLLRNPESLKQAIVLSEILNRKF